MADRNRLLKTARGAVTVAQRRGLGYFGYLLGGVAWPRAAYRFGWGPSAPPVLQGVFAAASELSASKLDAQTLRQLALLAPEGTGTPAADARHEEIERLMDRAHAAGITGVSRSVHVAGPHRGRSSVLRRSVAGPQASARLGAVRRGARRRSPGVQPDLRDVGPDRGHGASGAAGIEGQGPGRAIGITHRSISAAASPSGRSRRPTAAPAAGTSSTARSWARSSPASASSTSARTTGRCRS